MTLRRVGGLEVSLTETGVGERSVLILHGGSGPNGVRGLVDHVAHDAHVLLPTHPGWDGTDRPEWLTGVESLAALYGDLLEDAGLDAVAVIAHSFGGWVAAELAAGDRAHLISHLVLIDALGPAFDGHEILAPQPQPDRAPTVADLVALRAYTGPIVGDRRLSQRLTGVRIPTFLIWGQHDTAVAPAFGRQYAKAFPSARFAIVPDAGHVPWQDNPSATFQLIDKFLS